MKTATFSNGHTDTYKGKRDVRAAWMVILPTGKIISGHSVDIDTARKTAEGHRGDGCQFRELKMVGTRGRDIVTPAFAKYAHDVAIVAGFANRKEYNVHAAAKRADYISRSKIEVVAL
jgi:hypothetical protein